LKRKRLDGAYSKEEEEERKGEELKKKKEGKNYAINHTHLPPPLS
jgi:hypothetical protein